MIEIIRDGEPKQQESKLAAAVFECDCGCEFKASGRDVGKRLFVRRKDTGKKDLWVALCPTCGRLVDKHREEVWESPPGGLSQSSGGVNGAGNSFQL